MEDVNLGSPSLYPKLPEEEKKKPVEEVPEGDDDSPPPAYFENFNPGIALIIKATDLAARRHRFQKRKDPTNTPYINHPIGKYYLIA